jgi:hypothetical protein
MSTSGIEFRGALAQTVDVRDDALIVDLIDGRTISAPIAWFPRLAHGVPSERNNWPVKEFTGRIWTKTSTTKASFSAVGLAKASSHSSDGLKRGYR